MLRIFTIIIIFAAAGWFFIAMRSRMEKLRVFLIKLVTGAKDSLVKFRNPRSLNAADVILSLKILSYFIAVVCVLLLAFTGFIQYLIFGRPLSGFLLVLHVTIAPVFALCMTVICLLRAHAHVFDSSDQRWLNNVITGNKGKDNISGYRTVRKICFWLIVFLTPVIMGSIILSMYPAFGTYGQEFLLILHFVSALLFVIVSIIHTFLLINSTPHESKNE